MRMDFLTGNAVFHIGNFIKALAVFCQKRSQSRHAFTQRFVHAVAAQGAGYPSDQQILRQIGQIFRSKTGIQHPVNSSADRRQL